MIRRILRVSQTWIPRAAVGLELWFILLLFVLITVALGLPSLIEPNEGLMLEHVQHLARGGKLYPPPSGAWVPILYPPLYSYAALAVTPLFGVSLISLRIVSWCSVILSLFLIWRYLKLTTRSHTAAITGMGVFSATYAIGDCFLGAGRVDSLYLFLLLATFVLLHSASKSRHFFWAGIVAGLAILCKQTAIPFVIGLFGTTLWLDRGRALWSITSCAIIVFAGTLWIMHIESAGGWWFFYLFELPAQHNRSWQVLGEFFRGERNAVLFPVLLPTLTLGLYRIFWQRDRSWFFALVFISVSLATGLMGEMKAGGGRNHLIPLYAALGLAAGLAQSAALGTMGQRWHYLWYGCLFLQLGLLFYNPLILNRLAGAYSIPPSLSEKLDSAGAETAVFSHYSYMTHGKTRKVANFQSICDVFGLPENSPAVKYLKSNLDDLLLDRSLTRLLLNDWSMATLKERLSTGFSCKVLVPDSLVSPLGHAIQRTNICERILE